MAKRKGIDFGFDESASKDIVGADAGSGTDAITLEFGDPNPHMSGVDFSPTGQDSTAYQIPQPAQFADNFFVTIPYKPSPPEPGK